MGAQRRWGAGAGDGKAFQDRAPSTAGHREVTETPRTVMGSRTLWRQHRPGAAAC